MFQDETHKVAAPKLETAQVGQLPYPIYSKRSDPLSEMTLDNTLASRPCGFLGPFLAATNCDLAQEPAKHLIQDVHEGESFNHRYPVPTALDASPAVSTKALDVGYPIQAEGIQELRPAASLLT